MNIQIIFACSFLCTLALIFLCVVSVCFALARNVSEGQHSGSGLKQLFGEHISFHRKRLVLKMGTLKKSDHAVENETLATAEHG